MLTGAGLGLKGRLIGSGLDEPVTCTPSIRTAVLDARLRLTPPFDYRPICAQFEYRLMSLRRLVITLRAPLPAVRLAFVHFGVVGCKSRCVGQMHAVHSITVIGI